MHSPQISVYNRTTRRLYRILEFLSLELSPSTAEFLLRYGATWKNDPVTQQLRRAAHYHVTTRDRACKYFEWKLFPGGASVAGRAWVFVAHVTQYAGEIHVHGCARDFRFTTPAGVEVRSASRVIEPTEPRIP